MRLRPSGVPTIPALIAGAALGVTASASIALLLFTGQGFLRAAGLLVATAFLSVAAGVWAGAPEPHAALPLSSRVRWALLTVALFAGGIFATAWNASETLRAHPAGGAAAVLLLLAMPAYAAGSLLAGLHTRDVAGRTRTASSLIPAAAITGVAIGVIAATATLIQSLEPSGVFYIAGIAIAASALFDRGHTAMPARHGEANMNGHVALITGVGREGQLGYTLATRFLDAGARVVITSRSSSSALALKLAAHGDVAAVDADLTNDDDVQRLIDTARERFGRIDSVINAVGGLTLVKPIADTTPEEWRAEVERNVETTLRVCRAALPMLRESRGAIVNFTSAAGENAVPKLGAYSAAKAGVIALTRALALEELANGVRANAIAPGMMDTAQNTDAGASPKGVYVPREDVAAVALFLAGDGARGVSGEIVHVAGPTLR